MHFAGGARALIGIRVLMGIAQGPMFPACLALLSSWVPLKERSFIVSLTYGGIMVGTIAGTVISGVLLQKIEGWASVFYFFGATSIVWFLLFVSVPTYIYIYSFVQITNFQNIWFMSRLCSATASQKVIHSYRAVKNSIWKKNWAIWRMIQANCVHHGN